MCADTLPEYTGTGHAQLANLDNNNQGKGDHPRLKCAADGRSAKTRARLVWDISKTKIFLILTTLSLVMVLMVRVIIYWIRVRADVLFAIIQAQDTPSLLTPRTIIKVKVITLD